MKRSDNRHSVITVAICFLIAVIEGLDIQAAGIAAAGIRESFGLDSSQLGVFFSAGILGLLPGARPYWAKKGIDLVGCSICSIYLMYRMGKQF